MRSISTTAYLLISIIIFGVVLYLALPQKFNNNSAEPKNGFAIGKEAELAIPVIWNDFPEGVLLRAERSDWEVYARGERSIVVYDFRAEMMMPKQTIAAMQLEVELLDHDRQIIKSDLLEVAVDSFYKDRDLIGLNWRWQDTLPKPLNPEKLLVKLISTKLGKQAATVKDHLPLRSVWKGEKPKHVDLRFETRYADYLLAAKEEKSLFCFVVGITNIGTLDLEYLKLQIDAYAQNDSLLFSIEGLALDSHEAPLRVGFSRLSRFLLNPKESPPIFETKDISQISITILEADY